MNTRGLSDSGHFYQFLGLFRNLGVSGHHKNNC